MISRRILVLILIFVSCFLVADFSLAQSSPDVGIEYAENLDLQGGGQDVRVFLARVVQVALAFLGIIAVIYVMYAGWLWMTSEGAEDKVSKAKKTLVNAVIGLIIMLSAFMIVTWIINSLMLGGGGGTSSSRPGRPGYNGGLGVLGACVVENVYPEPGQGEVPRNTSIIITFKEEVEPTTLCGDDPIYGGNDDGICDIGEYVIPENFNLYKQAEGNGCPGSCANNVTEINVFTNDNKTFVFVPENYIGSPSEYLWYEVYVSNDVEKLNGDGVFSNCRTDFLNWEFHVSDQIDLTPPQVRSGGIFPAEDDARDTSAGAPAIPSTGTITFNNNPEPGQDAVIGGVPSVMSGSTNIDLASVAIDTNCDQTGTLLVSVLTDGQTAQLSNGGTLLGSAVFSERSINFPGYLSFSVTSPDFADAGDSWDFPGITPFAPSDTLRIGGVNYSFVSTAIAPNDIQVGVDAAATIVTAVGVINANPNVSAVAGAGDTIDIEAIVAGSAGNFITFTTTGADIDLAPAFGNLGSGADSDATVTVNDRRDKARNAVIQINFNEAIMPITVSGLADDVHDYIRVVNNDPAALPALAVCGNNNQCESFDCSILGTCVNDYLAGEFIVSNIYRTVEFVSDNLCGVNGCGEEIYCLPENSNVRVEIVAAELDTCVNCSAKSPYTDCTGGHCFDSTAGINFPLSILPMNGVMDVARNSLDGDRSDDAIGPMGYYDENTEAGLGDSYLWSFFINDTIDLTPPVIDGTTPTIGGIGVPTGDDIQIEFSKVLMCSSIRTGTRKIVNNDIVITHHNLNAWSVGGAGFGYWTACVGVDDGPIDGEYDWSEAQLRHSEFPEATSFRSQAGSGLKDIYQNCFKPSGSNIGCAADDINPSCCDGAVTGALGTDGNCP
jgi:hypothetical protein